METVPALPDVKPNEYKVFNRGLLVGTIRRGTTASGIRWLFTPAEGFRSSGKILMGEIVQALTRLDAMDGN